MKVLSLFCPVTKKFDEQRKFREDLSVRQKVLTIFVTVIAALVSAPLFGIVGMVAFRLMVEKFSFKQINPRPDDDNENDDGDNSKVIARKVNTLVTVVRKEVEEVEKVTVSATIEEEEVERVLVTREEETEEKIRVLATKVEETVENVIVRLTKEIEKEENIRELATKEQEEVKTVRLLATKEQEEVKTVRLLATKEQEEVKTVRVLATKEQEEVKTVRVLATKAQEEVKTVRVLATKEQEEVKTVRVLATKEQEEVKTVVSSASKVEEIISVFTSAPVEDLTKTVLLANPTPGKAELARNHLGNLLTIGQIASGNYLPIINFLLTELKGTEEFKAKVKDLIHNACFYIERDLACASVPDYTKIIEKLREFDAKQDWKKAVESEDLLSENKYRVFFWFYAAYLIDLKQKTRQDPTAINALQKIVEGARKMALETLMQRVDLPQKEARVEIRERMGDISTQECDWLQKRQKRVLEAQKILFNDESLTHPLRIGICLSGGGYRAMTYSSGFLTALQKLGIVDSSLYVSGLSGSTWFMTLWYLFNSNPEICKNKLEKIIPTANLLHLLNNPDKLDLRRFIEDVVLPKAVCGKPISLVDFFGGLLARALLKDVCNDHRHELTMADIAKRIESAEYPFPIFTAISATKGTKEEKNYNWYEFNPFEVENNTLGLSIPVGALGSKFHEGKAMVLPPESIGSLMGKYGSAYTFNVKDKIDSKLMEENVGGTAAQTVASVFVNLLSYVGLSDGERISPAKHNNPWHKLPEDQLSKRFEKKEHAEGITQPDILTFNDAGIDFNLPLIALLKQMRNLDVIFVGDASAGEIDKEKMMPDGKRGCPQELAKFFETVKEKGIEYSRKEFKDEKTNAALNFSVYIPKNVVNESKGAWIHGEKLPIIVYCNFLTDKEMVTQCKDNPEFSRLINSNKLDEFDAKECLKGYGETFNFEYHSDQFAQLAAAGEFNLLSRKDEIMTILKEAVTSSSADLQ